MKISCTATKLIKKKNDEEAVTGTRMGAGEREVIT